MFPSYLFIVLFISLRENTNLDVGVIFVGVGKPSEILYGLFKGDI